MTATRIPTPTAASSMTEDELVEGLIGAAAAGGWLVYHIRRSDLGIVQGHIGFPDIVAVHAERGALVVIEAKTERGRVDEAQERWLTALGAAGVDRRVVRPSDYDSVWQWLVGDRMIRRRGR